MLYPAEKLLFCVSKTTQKTKLSYLAASACYFDFSIWTELAKITKKITICKQGEVVIVSFVDLNCLAKIVIYSIIVQPNKASTFFTRV